MRKPKTRKTLKEDKKVVAVKEEPKITGPSPSKPLRSEIENHSILQVANVLMGGEELDSAAMDNVVPNAYHLATAVAAKDDIEALLGAQMAATHQMVMKFFYRANLTNQTVDGIDCNINRANKLMRTYLHQLEALDKHRGKGQQKVTVEHVTVNQGGQAIIGAVERAREGGDK